MDLFSYKPKEAISKTSKLEIREIFNGENELLLTVDVYSVHCEKARNAATVRDKVIADEEATAEQKEAANSQYIAELTAGWVIPEGHTLGGKRPNWSLEEAATVASKWELFSTAVLNHAAKITNYGDKAKKS